MNHMVIIAGDLNGHVGDNADGFEEVHGNFGFGNRNNDGLRILEFAESHKLCILNTYFKKPVEHRSLTKAEM